MLFQDCLSNTVKKYYNRNRADSVLLYNFDGVLKSNVRDSKIEFDANLDANIVDEMFINAIFKSSEIENDIFEIDTLNDFILSIIATKMGQRDCYPENLLVSNKSKLFENEKQIKIIMKGNTCSRILNNVLSTSFTVNIRKVILPEDILIFLSNKKTVGTYKEINGKFGIIVRPLGCFKIHITKCKKSILICSKCNTLFDPHDFDGDGDKCKECYDQMLIQTGQREQTSKTNFSINGLCRYHEFEKTKCDNCGQCFL